eukprot:6213599-Pleurochrysis_carterae.AAC.1
MPPALAAPPPSTTSTSTSTTRRRARTLCRLAALLLCSSLVLPQKDLLDEVHTGRRLSFICGTTFHELHLAARGFVAVITGAL